MLHTGDMAITQPVSMSSSNQACSLPSESLQSTQKSNNIHRHSISDNERQKGSSRKKEHLWGGTR